MKGKDFKGLVRNRRKYLDTLRLLKQWNKRLAKDGFSMEKGRSDKVIYAGDMHNLEIIEKYQVGDAD
jgi:hypothetical protein